MRFFSGRLMSHHPESCGFHPHPHPRRFIRRSLTDEYIHDNLSISLGVFIAINQFHHHSSLALSQYHHISSINTQYRIFYIS